MARIAVYGASGFVGRALCKVAAAAGHEVVALLRRPGDLDHAQRIIVVPDPQGLHRYLRGCDWMVNCAGRAHILKEDDPVESAASFHRVNCDLAAQLAREAKSAGICRFVQISSVAAIRSSSRSGETISDATPPAPERPYGISKLQADHELSALSDDRMRIVSLRPPALIGEDPAGLVAKLAWAADKGIPLPFGAIDNRRSFVAVDNLASAVIAALSTDIEGPFIITDSPPMSAGTLYANLLRHAGYSRRCFSVPKVLLNRLASLALGNRRDSLMGDAAYDGSRFMTATGWTPAVTMDDAQARMMAAFSLSKPLTAPKLMIRRPPNMDGR